MSLNSGAPSLAPESVVAALRDAVAGPVHAPGTAGYDSAAAGFNLAIVHRPAAVVVASCAADVAAAVTVAARAGLTVAVQSTGHGAAAAGPESVLIVTSRLDSVVVDPRSRTATVGAGVRWQQVLDATAPHGLAGLCGSAPHVGVVGYTLGGGIGPVARSHGFAADHVLEIEVVTADGRLRRVDADTDPDLFWALRGGGGAFGVVTQLTFRLHGISTLYAGGLYFDVADARRVLHGWRDWVDRIPDSVTSSIAVINFPPLPELPQPLRGRTVVHVRFAYVGGEAEGQVLLAPLRGLATPLIDTVAEIKYADLGSIHADPTDPLPGAERAMLLRELPSEAVDAFLASIGPDGGLPLMLGEIRAMGGALARDPATPNSVGGRDARFSVFVVGILAPEIAEIVPDALESVVTTMQPWATGGSLMTFAGAATGRPADRVRAAWHPDTTARLTVIRDRVDATGVFAAAARW